MFYGLSVAKIRQKIQTHRGFPPYVVGINLFYVKYLFFIIEISLDDGIYEF